MVGISLTIITNGTKSVKHMKSHLMVIPRATVKGKK